MLQPLFKNLLLCSLLFSVGFLAAQTTVPSHIKTIQLRAPQQQITTAIVPLGTILELSFDDLDADQKEYQYKITHMDIHWNPSAISSSQYLNGFDQNTIESYENSFNTLQSYTHYQVNIPNEYTQILTSGNYLISVLDEDDTLLFSKRCVFYEHTTAIGVAVTRSHNPNTIDQQQAVEFVVNYPHLKSNNPAQEIQVAVLQNEQWSTAITQLQPRFFKQYQLVYKLDPSLLFWAGNEYLNFDTKYVRNTGMNIYRTVEKSVWHTYLYPNQARAKKVYQYNPDINGQFVVRTLDGDIASTEADYTQVHFSLQATEEPSDEKIYVVGAFNNFTCTEENAMQHNSETGLHEVTLLLKQGFYNYGFATKKSNSQPVDTTAIDGNFYQTENQYTVIAYYTAFGENYQRVVGVGKSATPL